MSEIEDLKKQVKRLIKFGFSEAQIIPMLKSNNSSLDSVISDVVKDTINEYPNYGLIQKIMRSYLVCDQQGEDPLIAILDLKNKDVASIHKSRLLEMFDQKFDLKSRIYTANYEYRPEQAGLLIKADDGTFIYNTYVPPEWYEDYFYSSGKVEIPKVDKIPKIYHDFIFHLVNGNKASYDYIIKWIANGLRYRNYCILTTIGKQGIGKGILGEIMRRLFGSSNYYAGSDRMFKGVFNSQIANRKLVYCDEIFIQNKEEEDRIKLVVNDNLEIEKKGIDAKEVKNYANFYVSSNNMDSLILTADDRRFSIVDLTDIKLTEVFNSEQINALLDSENILNFARFLWHFEFNPQEMVKVFISERTEEVRSSSLKEWEEFFIFKFCPENKGKSIEIYEAGESIKEQFGYSVRIGRKRFQDLQTKYPDYFKVTKTGIGKAQRWVIEIL